MIMIIGTPDSGKSQKAEQLITEYISKMSSRGEITGYYIATMIPYGEEGLERVRKHRRMREGKGLITLECPVNLRGLESKLTSEFISEPTLKINSELTGKLNSIPDDSPQLAALLECVTNLVGNEMYDEANLGLKDEDIVNLCVDEIRWLDGQVSELFVVTNTFSEDDSDYDAETIRYVRLVNAVNNRLCELSKDIIRMV